MKTSSILRYVPILLCVATLASVRKQGSSVSYTPSNALSNDQDLLPATQFPTWIGNSYTNDTADNDTYLGGSQYARPDGEVFTAPMEELNVPDSSTLWSDQTYTPASSEDDSASSSLLLGSPSKATIFKKPHAPPVPFVRPHLVRSGAQVRIGEH